jgi:hypothetical protein
MIPLLIRVFELKLAAQQANTPPSRLQKASEESLEKIREQLSLLSKNLDLLRLWCESSQKQVLKALSEAEEMQKGGLRQTATSVQEVNPAIEKSFSEALSSQKNPDSPSPNAGKDSNWLRNLFPW